MARRCKCLEKEHPEVRHKVARDPVVRVVKKYFHFPISRVDGLLSRFNLRGIAQRDGKRRSQTLDPDVKQAFKFAPNYITCVR